MCISVCMFDRYSTDIPVHIGVICVCIFGRYAHAEALMLCCPSTETRLQEALDVGRLAQRQLIEKMDKNRDPDHALAVGDWAYVDADITPIPGNPHFRVKYAGPFFVKAVTTSTATLDIPEHWQISTNTFNVDKLKKHVVREGDPLPPCPRRFARRGASDRGVVTRVPASPTCG